VEKIIIKEALDAILKSYNRLDGGQYVALLNQYQYVRESFERNTTEHARKIIAEEEAKGLRAVVGFLFEAHMIKRDQREKLWAMIDTIRAENK